MVAYIVSVCNMRGVGGQPLVVCTCSLLQYTPGERAGAHGFMRILMVLS